MKVKKFLAGMAGVLALGAGTAQAASHTVTKSANSITLANWGNSVVAAGVSSQCAYGFVTFPSSTSQEAQSRFFSMILTAKMSNRNVVIVYNHSGSSCTISQFQIV